jgi:hypothetical protein
VSARNTALPKSDVDTLDNAHAIICTEWEMITIALGADREKHRRSINLIGEQLDIINDLIRLRRRINSQPVGTIRDAKAEAIAERISRLVPQPRIEADCVMAEEVHAMGTIRHAKAERLALIASEHRPGWAEEYERRTREEIAASESFEPIEDDDLAELERIGVSLLTMPEGPQKDALRRSLDAATKTKEGIDHLLDEHMPRAKGPK